MRKQLKCGRCGKIFIARIVKVYAISRAGETKEQVTEEKLPDGTVKQHIKNVPVDPFMITRSFEEASQYLNNPAYTYKKLIAVESQYCQTCRNVLSRINSYKRKQMMLQKRDEKSEVSIKKVREITEDEAKRLDKRLARALLEGRVSPPPKEKKGK